MPITGTQPALMECRSGVERCGATRSGYYIPYVFATINGTPVRVADRSLRLAFAWNGVVDRAWFAIDPSDVLMPAENQIVLISTGAVDHREFGGQIVAVTSRYERGWTTPLVQVECVGWQRLFDRRLVKTYFENESAGTIITAIVQGWTDGFTTHNVEPNLPTIEFFACTFEPPSVLLQRLATMIKGGGLVDAYRDVHLFGAGGETSSRAGTAPVTLALGLSTLVSFEFTKDASQQRNRVYADTRGAQVSAEVAAGMQAIPVDDAAAFINGGGSALIENYGAFDYGGRIIDTSGTTTSGPVSAGATSLPVTSLAAIAGVGFFPGWLLVGGRQYLYYTGGSAGNVTGIPASGAGSIQSDIASGEAVVNVPFISALVGGSNALTRAVPKGTYIATIGASDDAAAQAALAAVEGGDGVHEYRVTDRRVDVTNGAAVLADPDLENYADALVSAAFETEDFNAKPGRPVPINFTGTGGVSTTLVITDVDVTFPETNGPPRRRCKASTVRTPGVIDAFIAKDR